MAARTRATVLAADYRLAPAHAHPAAVDDVITVWRHVLEHHDAASSAIFSTLSRESLPVDVLVD